MPTRLIEEDYPGLADGIRQLRGNGFTEDEIDRAVQARIGYLERSGAPGEAIDALLKGRPGPLSFPDVVKRTKSGTASLDPMALAAARQQFAEYRAATQMPAGVDPETGRVPWSIDFGNWHQNIQRNAATVADWASGFVKGAADELRTQGSNISAAAEVGSSAFYRSVAELFRPPQAPEVMEDPVGFGLRRLQALGTVLSGGLAQGSGEYVARPIEQAGYPRAAAAARTATEVTTGSLLTPGIGFKVPEGGVLASAFQVGESMQIPSAMRATEDAQAAFRDMREFADPVIALAKARRQAKAQMVQDFHTQLGSPTLVTEQASGLGETFGRVGRTTVLDSRAGLSVPEAAEAGPVAATEPLEGTAAVAEPSVRALRGRGRPVTRPLEVRTGTTQLSDDAVYNVMAAHLAKNTGASFEEALASAKAIGIEEARDFAGNILREHRLSTGELSGKAGRPRVAGLPEPEPPSSGSELVDEMTTQAPRGQVQTMGDVGSEVTLPKAEKVQAPVFSLNQVRKIADSKGFDLQYDATNPTQPFKFIQNGGEVKTFRSLMEAHGYLDSQEATPRQPIELKTAASGESAFEKAVKGEPLGGDHQINLKRQKMMMESARSKPGGLVGDEKQVPRTEFTEPPGMKPIQLREGQQMGTVEDLC